MSDYFLLQQDILIPGTLGIGLVPDGMEPDQWLLGKKIESNTANVVEFQLSESSGDFPTDIIDSFFTIMSKELKEALDDFGLDNIDYYHAKLRHPLTGKILENYFLSNVIGRIECVDLTRSEATKKRFGNRYDLKSFEIRHDAVGTFHLFRLHEKPTLIIIDFNLRNYLIARNLKGLYIRSTREYDGYGGGSIFDKK